MEDYPHQEAKLLWQPELRLYSDAQKELSFSASLSSQSYMLSPFTEPTLHSKLYRAWAGTDLKGHSVKLGLQRMNFGTASLIRPMQWFDRLDPLDASEETEGVVGALLNLNLGQISRLQLWAIRGEDETKGNEFLASKEASVEPGARLEFPAVGLNWGLAYHYRKLDETALVSPDSDEHRLGLDLRWDGSFGMWLESSASQYPAASLFPRYHLAYTMGADYTVGLGNGLYILGETAAWHSAYGKLDTLESVGLSSAVMASYPLGLLDTVQVLSLADWKSNSYSSFLQYSRIYDYWSLSLGLSQEWKKGSYPRLNLSVSYDV